MDFLTPEENKVKKELKKKLSYIAIFVCSIAITIGVTFIVYNIS
ncbi:hypothetical protein ACQKFO_21480 [Rossellomorea sp. NPDC071047]